MKLTDSQKFVLHQLSKPYTDYEYNHPKDAYNSRTLESLKKYKWIEEYYHSKFLHGAIRLTDEGKRVLLDYV